MKTLLTIFLISITIINCGDSSSSYDGNTQKINLRFIEKNEFDPFGEHGAIDKFKITVTGENLSTPIIQYYPFETESVEFEELSANTQIEILVEAINYNEMVVRRGRSGQFDIVGGQISNANIEIYNVPIFANVTDGSQVYSNRFIPKVFAPGGIQFQVIDEFNDSQSILADKVTGEATFSINENQESSIKAVYSSDLPIGTHKLTVKDVNTDEATTISIQALNSSKRKVLPTTAGGFVGGSMSKSPVGRTNLPLFFMNLADF